jgi:hypothetical protein
MADKKISALTGATTPLAGTEVLPIVQSGATVKVSVNDATGITRPFTNKGVVYASSTSVLSTSAALTWNGSELIAKASGNYGNVIADNTNATGGGSFIAYKNGSDIVYFCVSGAYYGNTTSDALIMPVTGKSLRLGASAAETAVLGTDQNISISTAAKGINFTANTPAAGMTSQLLNWYEEGTWTPSIGWGGSGSVTTTTALGRYRRIGSEVTVWATLIWSASSASGGYLSINGAPFTPNSTTDYYTVGTVISANLTYVGQIGGAMNPGSANIYLTSCSTAAASVTLTGSELGVTGGNILLTMVYHL